MGLRGTVPFSKTESITSWFCWNLPVPYYRTTKFLLLKQTKECMRKNLYLGIFFCYSRTVFALQEVFPNNLLEFSEILCFWVPIHHAISSSLPESIKFLVTKVYSWYLPCNNKLTVIFRDGYANDSLNPLCCYEHKSFSRYWIWWPWELHYKQFPFESKNNTQELLCYHH